VPRAEAVGFYIYGPKFHCVRGHTVGPGLVRESCLEKRFGGSREVAPCNLPGPLVPRNPHRRRRPRPGRTGPSALQPRFTGDSKWFRRGGGGAQPSRGKCAPPAPAQGLTFRRNFAEISVFFPFPLVTGIRNFGIFRYISFQNSKFNKFRPKSTEIRRNSPKFRNGIPFPPITGILPKNEMVNPAPASPSSVTRYRGELD